MDDYLSDREQAERLKQWWVDNYKAILAGIIVAIAIIFGWHYWQHRTQTRGLTASAMYSQMSTSLAEGNGPQALQVANQLINDYSDTPYAAQAALAMARYDQAMGKPDDSMQMLVWVIHHSKDEGLRLLARLRLARVKLAVDDPAAALHALAGVRPGGFAALYDEARGNAYMKLGKIGDAREAYERALTEWKSDMGDRSLLEMKLDDLGQAPPVRPIKPPVAQSTAGVAKP